MATQPLSIKIRRLDTLRRDRGRVERLRRRWTDDEGLFERLTERERVACEVACDALDGVSLRTLTDQLGLQSYGQAQRLLWEGVAILEAEGGPRAREDVLRDLDRQLGVLRNLVRELRGL